MKLLDYQMPFSPSRTAVYNIYPIGDVHIGALNCSESALRSTVKAIRDDPNAVWFGGGDYVDAVIFQDAKRFDPEVLPDWMLTGSATHIRKLVKDIAKAQVDRFLELTKSIHPKCIGLIQGNHEYALAKYHNRDVMSVLCAGMGGVPDLTDCSFVRLRFCRSADKQRKGQADAVVLMFVQHGHGGGRSAGSEPGHLTRMIEDKHCDLAFRGHSHTYAVLPPKIRLTVPTAGRMPDEVEAIEIRAANWGTYLKTYAAGPGTYDSRASYPARPMSSVRAEIVPFCTHWNGSGEDRRQVAKPDINIHEVSLLK